MPRERVALNARMDGAFLAATSFTCVYLLALGYSSFTNHFSFHTFACDLGLFNQDLWSSLFFGVLFFDTIGPGTHFIFHFDPILFLMLPFYSFFPSPLLLLAVQTLFIGLGAIPLFLLSREELGSGFAASLIAAAYLLNPSLQGVNLYDFHPDCFFPFFFLSALYYMRKGRMCKFLFFTVLTLMCKEIAAFTVIALGLYLMWFNRRHIARKLLSPRQLLRDKHFTFPCVVMVMAAVWFYFSLKASPPSAWLNLRSFHWSYLGFDMFSILRTLVTNPVYSIQAGLTPNPAKFAILKVLFGKYIPDSVLLLFSLTESTWKAAYVLNLLFPVGFIPLLSPMALLPAFPWFFLTIMSPIPVHYQAVGTQYPALILPFLFFATVMGLKKCLSIAERLKAKLFREGKGWSRRRTLTFLVLLLLACSSTGFYLLTPVRYVEGVSYRDSVVSLLASTIPPYSTVLTQSDIFPHLTPTLGVYLGHYTFMPEDYYDYVLVDRYSPMYYLPGCCELTLFYERLPPSKIVPKLMSSGEYVTLFDFNGILLLKKA